jgi:hypothetical protein
MESLFPQVDADEGPASSKVDACIAVRNDADADEVSGAMWLIIPVNDKSDVLPDKCVNHPLSFCRNRGSLEAVVGDWGASIGVITAVETGVGAVAKGAGAGRVVLLGDVVQYKLETDVRLGRTDEAAS